MMGVDALNVRSEKNTKNTYGEWLALHSLNHISEAKPILLSVFRHLIQQIQSPKVRSFQWIIKSYSSPYDDDLNLYPVTVAWRAEIIGELLEKPNV